MNRIHITASGKAAPCTASIRDCPRGGSDAHFDSLKDAVIEINRRAAEASKAKKSPATLPTYTEWALLKTIYGQNGSSVKETRQSLPEAWQALVPETLDPNGAVAMWKTNEGYMRAEYQDPTSGKYRPLPELTTAMTYAHIARQARRVKGVDASMTDEEALAVSGWGAFIEQAAKFQAEADAHFDPDTDDPRYWEEKEQSSKSPSTKADERDSRHRYGGRGEKKEEEVPKTKQASKELDPAMIEALKAKFLKVKKIPFDESGLSIPELLQMAQKGELG